MHIKSKAIHFLFCFFKIIASLHQVSSVEKRKDMASLKSLGSMPMLHEDLTRLILVVFLDEIHHCIQYHRYKLDLPSLVTSHALVFLFFTTVFEHTVYLLILMPTLQRKVWYPAMTLGYAKFKRTANMSESYHEIICPCPNEEKK